MLSDPGSQASDWIEWPSTDRDAGSDMDYDKFFDPWRKRGRFLRTRACPGDEMSLLPATLGSAGSWQDQTPTSRFWFPAWAQRLVMMVTMRIVNGTNNPEGSNQAWVRARFGSPGSYAYSGEPSVFLACVVGTRNVGFPPEPETYCAGVAPDAEGTVDGGLGVWYVKRMLFDVPASMRGTEQPFLYQVMRNGIWVNNVEVRNSGLVAPHCGWYLIAREEAA